MKALRNGMLTIAALALAGIFTGTANAQAKAAGSFTLPFEAKWGNAVLPPGNYTFSVHSANSASGAVYLVTLAPQGRIGETITSRSEEHTSELQSLRHLVCRLLLEKKKK